MADKKRDNQAPSAPAAVRLQFTATANERLLRKLDTIARETGRNRSEMIDRLIEFYVQAHPEGKLAAENHRQR